MTNTTTPSLPLSAEQLDKLEELMNTATAGNWSSGYADGVCGTRAAAGVAWDLTDTKAIPVSVDGEVVAWIAGFEPSAAELWKMQRDADFIAAAKNALPSLIAQARTAQQAPVGLSVAHAELSDRLGKFSAENTALKLENDDLRAQISAAQQATASRGELSAASFHERFKEAYECLVVAELQSPFWNRSMEQMLAAVDAEITRRASHGAQVESGNEG